MPNLPLTLACWDYDRTRPLVDGRVKPDGIDLAIKVMWPRQIFPRMLERQEFDASELSFASYVGLKARGACPFVAIPVALSKIFRHSCVYVRPGAGIRTPQDLRGKRVGTTQYGASAVVFMRGMMQHDYGVHPQDVHWLMGGLDAPTQTPLISLHLPPDIKLDYLTGEATLEGMMETVNSMRCFRSTSQKSSATARRRLRGYGRISRRSRPTITGAPGFFPSCISWRSGRTCIAQTRGWQKTSTRHSAPRGISPWRGSTIATHCISRCRSCSTMWRKPGACLAAISGPTGLRPTGRPLPPWAVLCGHEQGLAPLVVTPEEMFLPGIGGPTEWPPHGTNCG